jgi:vitamin B12/bleomycin/antimicrobial peptide transport system ATP-binding/permease protein
VHRRGGALISIGHRPSLAQFHRREWDVQAQAGGPSAYRLRQA